MYDVLEASNGKEALEIMRREKNQIALLLLDLVMPELDGYGVLNTIKTDPELCEMPVIVISAEQDTENEIRSLNLGAWDYITKPFDAGAVLTRASNLISRNALNRLKSENEFLLKENRRAEEDRRRAETDPMTGLENRQTFFRNTEELLERNRSADFAIICWDIKSFKVINDRFGLPEGDRLLRSCGEMVKKLASDRITVGCLGVDHFAICRPDDPAEISEMIEKITSWLSEYPIDLEIAAYFGIYQVKDRSLNVALMCDRALLALESVKGNYIKRVTYFDDEMRDTIIAEQEISSQMTGALKTDQFRIFLQPQINYVTGEVIGAEALARWFHPENGAVSPAKFIPIFEKNGLITRLDEYMWRKACETLRSWMDSKGEIKPVPISVNISRMDIYNPQLCDILCGLVEEYRIPFSGIKLEITESAYVENPGQLIDAVERLRGYGFTVEMDDFGSGYSSLNSLKDVPVDVLKIDPAFLSEGNDSERGGNILASVVRMAKWLKLPIIAEGVETERQADYLKSVGCYAMQGYYFARPMPVEEFEKYLKDRNTGSLDRPTDEGDLIRENAFWDPDSQNTLLFNSFLRGAAIIEYFSGNAELLRANDKFYQETGTTPESIDECRTDLFRSLHPEDGDTVRAMLDKAVAGEEAECESRWYRSVSDGCLMWLQIRIRVIARTSGRYMLYAGIQNITCDKEMSAALDSEYERLRGIMDHFPGAVIQYTADDAAKILYINETAAKMFGRADGSAVQTMDDVIYPEDYELLKTALRRVLEGGAPVECEHRYIRRDGAVGWMRGTSVINTDGDGYKTALATYIDITDGKNAEDDSERYRAMMSRSDDKLRWQTERYRIMSEIANAVMFDYDPENDVFTYSVKLPGKRQVEKAVRSFRDFLSHGGAVEEENRGTLRDALNRAVERPDEGNLEFRVNFDRRGYRWCRLHYASVADGEGKVSRIVGRIDDTETEHEKERRHQALEEALKKKAEIDGLTELYNKDTFEMLASTAMSGHAGEAGCSFFIIDIDNFKAVNDTLGHPFGDSFLKTVGTELRKLFRENDIVGRIGGDEFAVLLTDCVKKSVVEKKAAAMVELFRRLEAPGLTQVNCSVGAATASAGMSYAEIASRADTALYEAKSGGKNQYRIFSSSSNSALRGSGVRTDFDIANDRHASDGTVVEQVFKILYSADDTKEAIRQIIADIGKNFDVSRVYIFEDSEDGKTCSNTFEWCGEGITPEIDMLQNVRYEEDLGGNYRDNFDRDGVFCCRDVSELPIQQYDILSRQGIYSVLQCAITDSGRFRGYVGFDECRARRMWTTEQLETLSVLSKVLSVFLLKTRSHDQAVEFSELMRSILDNLTAYVYIVEPESYEIKYCNRRVKSTLGFDPIGQPCFKAVMGNGEPCNPCPVREFEEKGEYAQTCIYNRTQNLTLLSDAARIKWKGKEMLLVSSTDITGR